MIHFEKSAPVKLKGAGGGLRLILDPSHPEDLLISEVDKLFKKLNHLAVNAGVTIDVGQARGQEDLIHRVKQHLEAHFAVGSVSDRPEKKRAPVERTRSRDLSRGWDQHRSDVLMLRGRVRSGQRIDTQKHLIITGDVNPGADIVARGNVMVLGKLSGTVHAGSSGDESALVFALALNATQISIGPHTLAGHHAGKWDRPVFAAVENGEIRVKDYMKENPFGRLPWPEVV